MSTQTQNAEPINPLVGDLVTVPVVRKRDEQPASVQGRIVAPGLAIVPGREDKQLPGRPRYNLSHVPTGLGVYMDQCGTHVQEAAKLAVDSGIDWTIPSKNEMVAAIKATDLLRKLSASASCGAVYCEGDGPEPPPYEVRCQTCDWEWEDEYDEGPLTRERAVEMAQDHECEPEVEIKSPITGKWHQDWALKHGEEETAKKADGGEPS